MVKICKKNLKVSKSVLTYVPRHLLSVSFVSGPWAAAPGWNIHAPLPVCHGAGAPLSVCRNPEIEFNRGFHLGPDTSCSHKHVCHNVGKTHSMASSRNNQDFKAPPPLRQQESFCGEPQARLSERFCWRISLLKNIKIGTTGNKTPVLLDLWTLSLQFSFFACFHSLQVLFFFFFFKQNQVFASGK